MKRRLSTHRKQKSHKFPVRVQKSEAAKQIKTVSIASPNLYSLRKHPFLLALRRWGRFARRNETSLAASQILVPDRELTAFLLPVSQHEERGETDAFAG